jgi:catalase
MHGYSGHTFKLVNKEGKFVYTQWHYRADKGFRTLTNAKAGELGGTNPDYGIQTLFDDIEKGEFPSWTVYVVRCFPCYSVVKSAHACDTLLFSYGR